MSGPALTLMRSYLSQGSIGNIIRRYSLSFHFYVDGTQLYITFEMTDQTNRLLSLCRIENCINYVRVRMVENLLKINDDKTIALLLRLRNNQAKHHITVITIGVCDITPSSTARNIGAGNVNGLSRKVHLPHSLLSSEKYRVAPIMSYTESCGLSDIYTRHIDN